MNRRRMTWLAPLILGIVLLAPACVMVHDDSGDSDYYAYLTFRWTFERADCVRAGVSSTVVEVYDRGSLVDSLEARCTRSGVSFPQGFEPGRYSFHIVGLDAWSGVLYEASGPIDAYSGDNVYDVDLYWAY